MGHGKTLVVVLTQDLALLEEVEGLLELLLPDEADGIEVA